MRYYLLLTIFVMLGACSGACSTGVFAADAVPIKIKSVRPCTATVLADEDNYEITVSLLPVRCFDAATNRELSFRKAEQFALLALLKYLTPSDSGSKTESGTSQKTLKYSGLTTSDRRWDEKSCRVVCRIPRAGVQIVPRAAIRSSEESQKGGRQSTDSKRSANKKDEQGRQLFSPGTGSILNLEDDYRDTIQSLAATLAEGTPSVPLSLEELDEFCDCISEREERLDRLVNAMKKSIADERGLLSIERDPLLAELNAVRAAAFKQLQRLAAAAERLSEYSFLKLDSEYADAISRLPEIDLQVGAVRIVKGPTGKTLLAVASYTLKDPLPGEAISAKDKLKSSRIAEARAKALLVSELNDGTQVSVLEEMEETTVLTQNGSEENGYETSSYSQTIEKKTQGVLRNIRLVGTWRSLDGLTTHVVLGCKIPEK